MTDESPTPDDELLAGELLAHLDFLAAPGSPRAGDASDVPVVRPDATSPPMPDAVWERLTAALAAEPRLAPVVQMRPRRRWLPAMAAAAVAVVAVGVVATVMRPTATPVADAPVAQPPGAASARASAGTPVDSAAKAQAAPVADGVQAPPPDPGPMVGAPAPTTRSMIMPTRVLMTSGTQYTSAGLDQQVDGLLTRAGAATPDLSSAVPTPVALAPVGQGGFTADLTALRDCITGLMHSSSATALIVDRATFDGADAGIVIVPSRGRVDVWVVGPECGSTAPAIMHHLLHDWTAAGR